MSDKSKRWIYTAGKWVCIRGGFDVIDFIISRDTLDYKTFNVGDYAGPTGGFAAVCDTLMPWQWDFPDTNRCGCFPAATITSMVQGNITYSTAGATISNTVFYGKVSVTAANITFINCFFLGPPTTESESIVITNAGANPTTFIDCTITTQNPNRWASGIKIGVGRINLERCDIFGVSDAVTPGANWTNGVYVNRTAHHDMIMYGPDPGAAGGIDDAQTHVDQNQLIGGTHVAFCSSYNGRYTTSTRYMEGNQPPIGFGGTPEAPNQHLFGDRYYYKNQPAVGGGRWTTSNMMWSPATNKLDTISYTYNWFDGAVYSINCAGYDGTSPAVPGPIDISYNHWGNKRREGDSFKSIIAQAGLQPYITCVGNVSAIDGSPLTKAQLIQNG